MKLFAISDLHVGYDANRAALSELPAYGDDWLILAGDIGETEEHLQSTLDLLGPRFAQLVWVPGNHELWSTSPGEPRGDAKYRRLVRLCRERGVITPEDPYPVWRGEGGEHLVAPLFLLYDYSFHPEDVATSRALEWAAEENLICTDEAVLFSDPYPSRSAWCHARCRETAARLDAAVEACDHPLILVNHFPLKRRLARLPAIPRFEIWCGTRLTEDWHRRYRAAAVVSGHLHIRSTQVIDGVRFEEVSLGYPGRQWNRKHGVAAYMRQILPAPLG